VIRFESLKLSGFRNFDDEIINFSPGTNIILGQNGHGKSNLLEAIYLLCTGKSFRTSHLKDLINFNKQGFLIESTLLKNDILHSIKIEFYPQKKKLTIDGSHYPHLHPLMGFLPVVIMTPEMKKIIDDGPTERRKFIDFLGSQISRPYFESITRYHKALKQRNAALKLQQETRIWEIIMATEWLLIDRIRKELIRQLETLANHHLSQNQDLNAQIRLEHVSNIPNPADLEAVKALYAKQRSQELHVGSTFSGPHRDELIVYLNGRQAQSTASEGQKKMIVAALCFASFDLMKQILQIDPLFLIDDYDAHFDLVRKGWIQDQLKPLSQSFLTSPLTDLSEKDNALFLTAGKFHSPLFAQ
jgi:DNA replication and repair protein RecF